MGLIDIQCREKYKKQSEVNKEALNDPLGLLKENKKLNTEIDEIKKFCFDKLEEIESLKEENFKLKSISCISNNESDVRI